MARPTIDDNEEKPLDPAVEKVRRKLVRFVAINLGLLFLALMAVLAAIVYKTGQSEDRPTVAAAPDTNASRRDMVIQDIRLPRGSRVISHSISGDRLSLHVAVNGGEVIAVYDMSSGRMLHSFDLEREP
ncbi:MAG TPA: fimbrial protein [Pseudaminobacter sp.]|nr:fimbrial protein [Pseudaminobacter sp.]